MCYRYLVGRILFSLIFITAAPRHFTAEGIHHAADLGVPLASLLVPLSWPLPADSALPLATMLEGAHGCRLDSSSRSH